MTESEPLSRPEIARRTLREALAVSLPREAFAWVEAAVKEVAAGAPRRRVFGLFSSAVHRVGKADLDLSERSREFARTSCGGWKVAGMSCDEAARGLIVLSIPADDPVAYATLLDEIHDTADIGEAVALHRVLPVLPHPETHAARAALGVRSNITAVFEAVALDNPYPRDHLDDGAFAQMVLKAVFGGSDLNRIVGLDERATPDLAKMLVDYAHERWAAGRDVDPRLWRPVGPHADLTAVADLARLLADRSDRSDGGSDGEREAAALALASCPRPEAVEALGARPDLAEAAAAGKLDWSRVVRSEEKA